MIKVKFRIKLKLIVSITLRFYENAKTRPLKCIKSTIISCLSSIIFIPERIFMKYRAAIPLKIFGVCDINQIKEEFEKENLFF